MFSIENFFRILRGGIIYGKIFFKKKQKRTPKDGFCCSINLKEDEI